MSRRADKDPGFVLMRLRMLVNDRARSWFVASAIIFTYICIYLHAHTRCTHTHIRAPTQTRPRRAFAPSRQLREERLLPHRPDTYFGITVMKANPRIKRHPLNLLSFVSSSTCVIFQLGVNDAIRVDRPRSACDIRRHERADEQVYLSLPP